MESSRVICQEPEERENKKSNQQKSQLIHNITFTWNKDQIKSILRSNSPSRLEAKEDVTGVKSPLLKGSHHKTNYKHCKSPQQVNNIW